KMESRWRQRPGGWDGFLSSRTWVMTRRPSEPVATMEKREVNRAPSPDHRFRTVMGLTDASAVWVFVAEDRKESGADLLTERMRKALGLRQEEIWGLEGPSGFFEADEFWPDFWEEISRMHPQVQE